MSSAEKSVIILGSAYFGPIEYFSCFIGKEEILIEQYDNYTKQTYRNRCIILGANESLKLVVPVKKTNGSKTLMKDIRIDYDTDWQKLHYRSILSSYRSSPFFDYYIDDILPFFEKQEDFLVDLNIKALNTVLSLLNVKKNFTLSNEFITGEQEYDFRDVIHPKKEVASHAGFKTKEYVQVFSDKLGFHPNLSILDLLFNTGPEAILYLK